ncbi:Uncharacterized protein FWK35_00037132, partial [Aphis craccivora]
MGIAVGQQQQHQQSLSSVGIVDSVASTSNVNDSIPQQAPTPPAPSVKRANTNSARNIVKFKKARIGMVNTPGFIELDSALDRTVVWYYRGNTENCESYQVFLESIKLELIEKINYCVRINPIKYNLKLESVYAHRELPAENRAFKTVSREAYIHSDVRAMVDEDFAALMSEEDRYIKKGSGFTLSSIDGLLLGIYEHTPLGGSSYIPLPENIMRKKAVINPMNIDDDCFKWAILARHVPVGHHNRVGQNYYNEEHRYDFSELSSPTPISEIHIFERRNKGVSVNVYGLKPGKGGKVGKGEKDEKVGKESVVYPIRVVENEKAEHFDLLVIEGSERLHYTYISNFSRLVRSQKTSHESRLFICKRCFTSFDEQVKKNKLRGNEALQQHMRLCGLNKPILPVMPEEGEVLGFNGWANMQRHPFAIYADFEALLEKQTERVGASTDGIHAHHPISYGYFVKAAADVPVALMEKYDIPQTPVIYRGSESRDEVAKHFIASVTALAIRLGNLLKATNVPISMGVEELRAHNAKSVCDMCNLGFTETRWKVADHCHLSGRLRHTLCAPCNLKLTTPKFVPCFLHNLSKYDAHFIVTELGYDKKSITVIPNTEENYISFSKRVMPDFSVRFLDSCRFMASSLAELAGNLLTRPGDFEKFRETAKVFQPT